MRKRINAYQTEITHNNNEGSGRVQSLKLEIRVALQHICVRSAARLIAPLRAVG